MLAPWPPTTCPSHGSDRPAPDAYPADSAVDKEGDETVYRLKVQISNKRLVQGYTLHQIGIYAKLDDSSSDALVCIFQDDHGFEVQPEAAMSNLLLEFYGMVVISGTAQVTVTADPAAIATEHGPGSCLPSTTKTRRHARSFSPPSPPRISLLTALPPV